MHDTKDAGPDAAGLFLLASEQGGYFTSAQAHAYGYNKQLLAHHAMTGRFRRRRRGLYRLRDYPSSPREEVMAAWLAAGKDQAVVSHESALDLLGLSDVVPSSIHLLVPRARRWFRAPPGVTLHTTTHPLSAADVVLRQGMRITAPLRTILDVAAAGTAPEQVILAITQAHERGMLVAAHLRQAARLRE
jgi:predicted transcriptional regulator of viral defense system